VEEAGSWWADGACSWNYPIDLFDGARRQPIDHAQLPTVPDGDETIGFCMGTQAEIAALKSGWQLPSVAVTDFATYMSALTSFLLNESTLLHLDAPDLARSVFIDVAGVRTTQFDLTPEQASTLVANGRTATEAFLAARAGVSESGVPGGSLPTVPTAPGAATPS
jgi:NTE family protein